MEAVLNLRRDPPLSIYVYGIYTKLPMWIWLLIAVLDFYVLSILPAGH